MTTLEKALEIAAKAHAGTKDAHGQPYVLHPIRVMLGVEDQDARIVAILHDVVEDTGATLDDIRAEGFSDEVIEALNLVTHQRNQPYTDYVIACKQNDIARQVKLSDLRDNSNLNRLLLRPEQFGPDSSRMNRYALSYGFLTDKLSEANYRQLMASFG